MLYNEPTVYSEVSPCLEFKVNRWLYCGPGSSVGRATYYGLEGTESNPGGDEIFRTSRLTLGPTQPPVQWVPGFSGR